MGAAPVDPSLDAAYRHCRRLTAHHGKSYHLATRMLPAQDRPAVHALYGFARTVDDVVDVSTDPPAVRLAELDRIEGELASALAGAVAEARPVVRAAADTITRYRIAPDHFAVFLQAMRMDLPGAPDFRATYPTMAALREYMRGSAAAIGLQMLPILGTVVPVAEAEPAAATLGEAFQLTNFLRDVGEDLDRGRIYLPADELGAFGVDADLLRACRDDDRTDRRVERALAHLVAVNRHWYRLAEPGLAMLSPRVRPGITAAFELYAAILDRIERDGYPVLQRRVVVPRRRRAAIVAAALTGVRQPAV
ncbi:phytoene/squalene synthase family protein [Rhodococcus gannanensis]|uniref:Phytoene/squalene synthase family protein n=1 Tax=Rhodococcus gannanensis TaxID=1960308 RepID=A0ABW4P5U5_9NOCA